MPAALQRRPTYARDTQQHRRHRPDYLLVVLMIALAAVGIVVVYSISPALAVEKGVDGNHQVMRQLIATGLGLGIFAITATVPLSRWRTLYKPLFVLGAIATIIALVLPVNSLYPAHRWVRVGGFSFQSVELLKFAGVMWLSGFLSWRMQHNAMADVQKTLKPLLAVLVGAAAVVAGLQSDLGSCFVILAMVGVMVFAAGMPMKPIIVAAIVMAVLGALFVSTTPYRRERLAAYLHPNCTSSGYQACQALIAVGSGGMIGLGLGGSVQAYGYLPEAENDSIFAVYAEKFGFVGTTALLGLYAAFFTRIKKTAERAPDDFTRLVVLGILVWLSAQTIVNVGAMIGLLPLKGITLPLVSYGGSSVLMVMAALGVVFQASKYTLLERMKPVSETVNRGAGYDNSVDRRRVRGAYHPTIGRRT